MLFIQILFFDCERKTLSTPIRNEINGFRNSFRWRNIKTEKIFRCQINACATEAARKNTVGFVQNYRGAALRALLFNLKVRGVHSLDYSKLSSVNFLNHTWNIFWSMVLALDEMRRIRFRWSGVYGNASLCVKVKASRSSCWSLSSAGMRRLWTEWMGVRLASQAFCLTRKRQMAVSKCEMPPKLPEWDSPADVITTRSLSWRRLQALFWLAQVCFNVEPVLKERA